MNWVRGQIVGRGSFGTVNLAIPITGESQIPVTMVVKSAGISNSSTLRNEKEVLSQLGVDCPQIIRCFGDDITAERAGEFYNLFLEFASEGSLADRMMTGGCPLPEEEVRRYTREIVEGLCYIHESGFVHCDIKLSNILCFQNGAVKISDFGLARRAGKKREKSNGFELRGTPLYMSPELVNSGEGEAPADIWALGCAVVEMITGKPAWNLSPESDVSALFYRIGIGGERPKIPGNLGEEGKDFTSKCLVKDPNERWTARMLLNHPFLSGSDEDADQRPLTSPRCPFEYPESESFLSSEYSPEYSPKFEIWVPSRSSVMGRMEQLVSEWVAEWSDSGAWVTVR